MLKPIMLRPLVMLLLAALALPSPAETAGPADIAARFGARPHISHAVLSPDGKQIAYVAATPGTGYAVQVQAAQPNAPARTVMAFDGKPEQVRYCMWLSNARLICGLTGNVGSKNPISFSRNLAVDIDGKNPQLIGSSGKWAYWGGDVIDWLVNEKDMLLIYRNGVFRVDTQTGKSEQIERGTGTSAYFTDGYGNVRIRALTKTVGDGYATGETVYFYPPRTIGNGGACPSTTR